MLRRFDLAAGALALGLVVIGAPAAPLARAGAGDGAVVIAAGPAAVVTAPPAATVARAPAVSQPSVVTGTIARIEEPDGVIVFSDGRTVLIGPETVILVNGAPARREALRPGMHVTVASVTPVVYRSGRYAVLNEGFEDPQTGSSALARDADYAGFSDRPATQIQAP